MEKSVKETILANNRSVPRYTSYPTAPHFREGFQDVQYRAWLSALKPPHALSLYVHVPFCPKLCWFCGCNTKITHRDAPVVEYADLLKREIAMAGALVDPRLPVRQLHFGGGSPTILKPATFESLVETLRENFTMPQGIEIAVEIDPRNFTPALAAAYARAGVNRVSFGVQDFNSKVMAAVNRVQPYDQVRDAMALARASGITGINVDLMYGLPYQTVDTMRDLCEKIVALAPDRLALFGYAHVPWMKKHMRLIPEAALPDDSLRYDLFETGASILERAGYAAIGIDHFAKTGDALAEAWKNGTMRRNFQGYTTDTADVLLGFGASAIGRLPEGYVQNTVHGPQYRDRLLAGHLPVEKSRMLEGADRLRADIIERLICDMRVDLPAMCKNHGKPLSVLAAELEKLKPLLDTRLVCLGPDHVLEVKVRQMARLACAAFDTYLQPPAETVKRHVTAV